MDKNFKKAYYVVLGILILIFFTQDIDIYKIDNPNDILVLVNKYNHLPDDYIPNDLEFINLKYSNEGKKLRHIARVAFENLSEEASKLGYTIIAVSAFRDYDYQKQLYNQYVLDKGNEYASMCSAQPGHSEHQTGLSLDVEGSNHDYDNFQDTLDFIWMKDNAHKFGFILRYPLGKEDITKFKYEPWHYRYVGIDVATKIYEENLTLEEYLKNRK